jgi:beta-lactamase class D
MIFRSFVLTATVMVTSLGISGCSTVAESTLAAAPEVDEVDLSRFFEGIDPEDATLVVLDGQTGRITRYNAQRAGQRFLPASTFKVPNALIALETGVASDADFTLPWDSLAHREPGFWTPSWSQDHTLRSAMRHSAYWYYQELARRIGAERMQRSLDRFEYGNRNMGGGLDRFWLHGDLRVSPDEQVRFLQRMYSGELGVSQRSTEILKDILVLEQAPDYRLSGKTGTADVTPTRELAWLVGYVERGERIWFYALNMEGEEVWEQWGPAPQRLKLLRELLTELDVLPDASR